MDQYILSLSYGKDSLACLGAIDKLGLPLDRIIHAEVWATDTIPADLPPMVEFKKKADAIIKYRWGIEVEHVYATCRGGCGLMNVPSMNSTNAENTLGSSEDSPCSAARGVRTGLKETSLTDVQKLTYEKIFYRVRSLNGGGSAIYGFPMVKGAWCNSYLKRSVLPKARALRHGGASIAPGNSKSQLLRIPDFSTSGKLVYSAQDQSFPTAPGHKARVQISYSI